MKFRTTIINYAKKSMKKFALTAVIFAEHSLGGGAGKEKKALAINFLLESLPFYLKPFRNIIQEGLCDFIDKIIEKAVDKLHETQGKNEAVTE